MNFKKYDERRVAKCRLKAAGYVFPIKEIAKVQLVKEGAKVNGFAHVTDHLITLKDGSQFALHGETIAKDPKGDGVIFSIHSADFQYTARRI